MKSRNLLLATFSVLSLFLTLFFNNCASNFQAMNSLSANSNASNVGATITPTVQLPMVDVAVSGAAFA